jgi:hypothetical protein
MADDDIPGEMRRHASYRLLEAGFSTAKYDAEIASQPKPKQAVLLRAAWQAGKLHEYADHEVQEAAKDQRLKTGYPAPKASWRIIHESPHASIEPMYFWAVNALQYDLGFPWIEKVTDSFTASEHSSFAGSAVQRLGLTQDRVSGYLATIGKLIKDLFLLVREMRWYDERLKHYAQADQPEGWEPGMTTLKYLWVDLVDGTAGGQRTASNLWEMARQLEYTALPDLFFSTHPRKRDDIMKAIQARAGEFNPNVRRVLANKLELFLTWKESTHAEMLERRKFTLKYLTQHFQTIKMYMNWIKPYLRQIERMGMDVSKLRSPDLVAAFEGSLIEVELLAAKLHEKNKDVYSTLLLTLEYRTRPKMEFVAESAGYHRGAYHIGEARITWRAYAWSQKQIEAYLKLKDAEDLAMLTSIDDSLRAAMDSLGQDLLNYLEEARKAWEPGEKKAAGAPTPTHPSLSVPGMMEPFILPFKAGWELVRLFFPTTGQSKTPAAVADKLKKEQQNAADQAVKLAYTHHKAFKKVQQMLSFG